MSDIRGEPARALKVMINELGEEIGAEGYLKLLYSDDTESETVEEQLEYSKVVVRAGIPYHIKMAKLFTIMASYHQEVLVHHESIIEEWSEDDE